jgi:hypothetical protein
MKVLTTRKQKKVKVLIRLLLMVLSIVISLVIQK